MFLLSDAAFATEILPQLNEDVVDVIVPEGERSAVRRALIRASETLAAELRSASAAVGGLTGVTAATAGDPTGGSISSTTQTSGESGTVQKSQLAAKSFLTLDGEALTVQLTAGLVDRMRANQHWLRIWPRQKGRGRRAHFLGDNIEMRPKDMIAKLDLITAAFASGFPPSGDDWKSMGRLREMRLLRVFLVPSKFKRLVAFEWHSLYPLRLSITDFVHENTTIDNLARRSYLDSTRSALQRALDGLALTLHVLTGDDEALFKAAFGPMQVALQGERSAHIPDVMLIHSINAAVGRAMYQLKREAPEVEGMYTEPHAFAVALGVAFATAAGKLPSSRDVLEADRFDREILPLLVRNAEKGAGSEDDSSSSGESDDDADTAGSTSGQTNKKRKRKTKGQSANKSKGRKATGAAVVAAATAGGAGQGGRVGNPAPVARGKAQPVATPCPYYLAEQLGTPLAGNPLRTFTCREGVKCKRGRHVPLRQLTRDEVRAAFEDASVSRFHVSSKSLELVAAAPATVFK